MSNLDNLIFLTSYEENSSNNFYIFNIELIKNLKSYDYYYSDKIHNFSKKFQFLEYPEKKDNPLNIYDALAWANNLDDIYCLKALLELLPCVSIKKKSKRENLRYILGCFHNEILSKQTNFLRSGNSLCHPYYKSILYGNETGEPPCYPVLNQPRSLNRDINKKLGVNSSIHTDFEKNQFIIDKKSISYEVSKFLDQFMKVR